MKIDPKFSMILNIIFMVLAQFATANWWDDLVGAKLAGIIVGVMVTVVTAGNVVLHAYSSDTPGPAAPPVPPVVGQVTPPVAM